MVFPLTRTLHWELLIDALIVFSLPRMMLTESVSTFLKIPASSLGLTDVEATQLLELAFVVPVSFLLPSTSHIVYLPS